MLKVSQKLEYSMRAMIDLALHEQDGRWYRRARSRNRSRSRFDSSSNSSGTLNKAGLVESQRGAGGGCRLARPASEIRASEIADAIEGAQYPMSCLDPSDHACLFDDQCGLQGLWGDIQRAIRKVFEETTLDTLAARQTKLGGPVLIAADYADQELTSAPPAGRPHECRVELLRLAKDAVHTGPADRARTFGHQTAVLRLGDLTVELALLPAFDAVALVLLGHRRPLFPVGACSPRSDALLDRFPRGWSSSTPRRQFDPSSTESRLLGHEVADEQGIHAGVEEVVDGFLRACSRWVRP